MTPVEIANSLPPALIFFAGALLLPFLPSKARSITFIAVSVLSFLWILLLEEGSATGLSFLNLELIPFRVDSLSIGFGYLFSVVAFAGGLYACHLKSKGEQIAALLYAGAALGAVFAGDLFTLFVFWEIMLIGSGYLVWARKNPSSGRAGMRYILVHLAGGSFLLAGILWHLAETGSIEFVHLDGAPSYLVLIGFAVNAAIPPLHAWLPDAYPESTVTGSVFLSAFTTKVAVYTLARGFEGLEVLMWAGAIMAVYGAVFAFLENDIRKILSYHIISQVGFMVAAIGLGGQLAVNGAVALAFTNILYKTLLFMSTGAVLYATGRSKLSDLGGLYKSMPKTFWLYMVGGVSISGFPLFAGFISKGMVIYAAETGPASTVFILLLVASVGTFLSVGLKLPYFAWFGKDRGLKVESLPRGMYAGMGLISLLCFVIGVFPATLYNILPNPVDYQAYTVGHLWETVSILTFTGLVFWIMKDKIKPKPGITLDFDWLYRKPAPFVYKIFVDTPASIFSQFEQASYALVKGVVRFGANPIGWFIQRGRQISGMFSKTEAAKEPYEFNPDRYRHPLGFMVLMLMLGFVVLAIIGLVHTL